ncbi:MAG: cyclodeaminase/cyclohydrolase family protein [Chloroflexia bacterium]
MQAGKVAVQDASPTPLPETLLAGTIADYLDQLASAAPAPGGGSVAALTAAQGAALVGMVLSLTIGRPRFQEHDAELRAIQAEADQLRAECAALIDRDATVLRALIATYKLPRATPEEKAARDVALQERTHEASEVPLAGARAAAAIVPLCRRLLPLGNPTAVSDIGVAAACALAAFRSAELNVLINLGTLKDEGYVAAARRELADLGAGIDGAIAEILQAVCERL